MSDANPNPNPPTPPEGGGDTLILPPEATPPAPTGDAVDTPTPPPAPAGRTFTAEDIERARREEKDKVYKTLEDTKTELEALRKEREDRQKREADAQRQAEEAAKKAAEDEMSAKELIEQKEREWQARFDQEAAERQRMEATLEMERRYSALQEYRAVRLAEEGDEIVPELRDMVTGNSEEEIEQSLSDLKDRSARILGNVLAAQQQQRAGMRGVPVTAPPVGPMDNEPGYEQVTADDIRNMDMATYSKNRQRLLGAAGSRIQERGLYG